MRTVATRRRNGDALPWLRAGAFAALTFLSLSALLFYPTVAILALTLAVATLGLLFPAAGIILYLVATAIPLLAGDIVAGALFLVLGIGVIQYLSESRGRAFLVIGIAFAATLVRAEWGIAALAGYLLGTSEGAVAAFVACLVIEGAGLVLGRASVGTLATGGSTALVDVAALARIQAPLSFAWFMPMLAKVSPAALLNTATGARDIGLFGIQPVLWAGSAAVAGMLRRPMADPRRKWMALVAVGVATLGLGLVSTGASLALRGPVSPAALAMGLAASIAVGVGAVAVSEWVFRPLAQPPARATDADEADVDELLRMISTAEEELANKHTVHAAVLITDMKSFARLTQELGSAEIARLVQRHRDLLLPVIARHGGKGRPTGGDGLLAAFPSPGHALAAAIEVQRELAQYNTSRPGEEALLIRAGVASGEVVLDRGGKPFLGDALNLAARVMSLADGGQVFTTKADAESAGAVPFGIADHGEFRLKNIGRPVEIAEVFWRSDQEAHAPASTREDDS